MATPKKNKSSRKGSNKTFAAKRTMNPPQKARTARSHASSFQQHDIKGRQGSFETEGQHARTGSRGHE